MHHILMANAVAQGGTPQRGRCANPAAVVMAPTRELVEQIFNDSRKFLFKSPIQAVAVFGGEGTMGQQLRELERGCEAGQVGEVRGRRGWTGRRGRPGRRGWRELRWRGGSRATRGDTSCRLHLLRAELTKINLGSTDLADQW